MGWIPQVILLFGFQFVTMSLGLSQQFETVFDVEPLISNDLWEPRGAANLDINKQSTGLDANMDDIEKENFFKIGNFLTELLMMPWNNKGLPLLYIEDEAAGAPAVLEHSDSINGDYAALQMNPMKRSRYYRKYPWKRQNVRQTGRIGDGTTSKNFWKPPTRESTYHISSRPSHHPQYDAENRYLCQPSKEDVYRLLVALHETRQGNRGHTINFCNRKRPATAIFTNIRFLG